MESTEICVCERCGSYTKKEIKSCSICGSKEVIKYARQYETIITE